MLVVEYPGYGVYKGTPNETQICLDAEQVFDYLTRDLEIPPQNIVVIGRSMGSGPAVHLASLRTPANLVLISPYTSIRNASINLVGSLLTSILAVKERFNNESKIGKVCCPILFIHGKLDKIVPYSHSIKLAEACFTEFYIKLNQSMGHNNLNVCREIANPIYEFWKRIGYKPTNLKTSIHCQNILKLSWLVKEY